MGRLTRRAFLWLAACTAPVAKVFARQARGGSPPPISLNDFLRMSQRLTGHEALDPKIAAIYLNALLTVPENGPGLARIVRGSGIDPTDTALEHEIVDCWYTGTYPSGATRRVATYTSALMWTAIGKRPPSTCAGAFGGWSRAPRED